MIYYKYIFLYQNSDRVNVVIKFLYNFMQFISKLLKVGKCLWLHRIKKKHETYKNIWAYILNLFKCRFGIFFFLKHIFQNIFYLLL